MVKMAPESQREDSQLNKETKIEKVSTFVDLLAKIVGLVTWPIILLVLLIMFYSPIMRIADLLPDKIEKSYEISVGNLSLKLQQKAIAAGNVELAKIIGGLSQEAIKWILKIADGSHRVIGTDDGATDTVSNYYLSKSIDSWIELQSYNLLVSTVDLVEYKKYFNSLGPVDGKLPKYKISQTEKEKLLNNSVHLSDSGKEAYDIILSTVSEMINKKR
jgi:hypothetical protein